MPNIAEIAGNIFVNAAENTAKANKIIGGEDYIGPDGLMVCGICHTPNEVRLPKFLNIEGPIVPCLCKCAQARRDEEWAAVEAEQRRIRIRDLTRRGITDQTYIGHTFENDDRTNPAATDMCRRYCDHWLEMLNDNIGIIFYGGVGTGKTFLACCIATELLSHGVPVCVTNMPSLIKKVGSFNSRSTVDDLAEFDLLIIDDLGVERDNEYMLEQEYLIVDARSRTGKPLIVTTNLSPAELRNPADDAKRRIYDRVCEMCAIPVKMDGKPRRRDISLEKREKAMRILNIRDNA